MIHTIKKAIKDVAGKAGTTSTSCDALKFSQAAVNLAHALSTLDENDRQAKIAGKS